MCQVVLLAALWLASPGCSSYAHQLVPTATSPQETASPKPMASLSCMRTLPSAGSRAVDEGVEAWA